MVVKRKKGQITILLVLVMVLLLVFGLMFFIKGGLIDIDSTDVLSSAEAKKKITESVEACIQHATQEGLTLIGLQGGAIYKDQDGGTVPRFLSRPLPYGDYDVLYVIKEGESPDPPEYPVEGALGSTYVTIGERRLKPLCDADGPNVWDLLGAEHTCISYDTPGRQHSIQDYLRVYILNKTIECMDFPEWASQYGVEIVPQGDAELEVVIGDTDVTAQLTYPIDVGGISVSSFIYQSRVRLKKIYELAYRLAEADVSDLTFFVDEESSIGGLKNCPSADRDNNNENCSKPGMSVEVNHTPCISCTDGRDEFADIVRIVDEESLIVGEPYVFQFARENRRPALDFIDETIMSGKYETFLADPHSKTENPYMKTEKNLRPEDYNVVVTAGDTIELIPFGLDPDEDELTYTYQGWKAGSKISPCPNPKNYKHRSCGKTGPLNHWKTNAQGGWRTHETTYTSDDNHDRGLNLLRVTVCDTAGLCDWQDVEIFINDKPVFDVIGGANALKACCEGECDLTIESQDQYGSPYQIKVSDSAGNICFDAEANQVNSYSFSLGKDIDDICSPSTYKIADKTWTLTLTDGFGASQSQYWEC